ncbi:exportin-1 isoform X1, partial [Clarias magur]
MPAEMTMLADHTARQLLDFSQKLDINLLDNVLEKEGVYLAKLNMILVQILKHWPMFISDIMGASRTSESLCQNNIIILSEEVFDFSSGQMTQNAPLVHATLETLLRFLNWIPLGYIFETKLISILVYKFLNVPMFRNVTLKCLTEIAGISVNQYKEQFVNLFTISNHDAAQTDAASEHKHPHGVLERERRQAELHPEPQLVPVHLPEGYLWETLMEALHYMLLVSEVEETEIFKICLEYWNHLAAELYRESPFSTSTSLLLSGSQHFDVPPRRHLYLPVLSKVRLLMVSCMAKPEEVLVVENDQGEVVREFMKDTDSINLYKNMRETLV